MPGRTLVNSKSLTQSPPVHVYRPGHRIAQALNLASKKDMDIIGGPGLMLRQRKPGALLGVLAFLAIAAVACGSGAAGELVSSASDPSSDAPSGRNAPGQPEAIVQAVAPVNEDAALAVEQALSGEGVDPDALPSPDPDGDAGQRIAAASEEFDAEAFARITPGGPRNVDPSRFRQLIGRDVIVPVYDPLVVSAAESGFSPGELVMGVALNGESRAYAVSMMRSREIANDEVGGIPILVTW